MSLAIRKPGASSLALPLVASRRYEGTMLRGTGDTSTGETGLRQLLGEMRSELMRFMLARQCDPANVEDLLQDLYVKLASNRTGPVSNPRAYLYQMANNLMHDHRRGRRRQEERDDHWTRSRIGPDLEMASEPSPEEITIARDELERVNEVLASMPDRTSQILKMYRLENLSQKEIACRLDLSLSAVEKHLQRAYRKLLLFRQELDGTSETSQEAGDAAYS